LGGSGWVVAASGWVVATRQSLAPCQAHRRHLDGYLTRSSNVEERRRHGLLRPTQTLNRLTNQQEAEKTQQSIHRTDSQPPNIDHSKPILGLQPAEHRLHQRTLMILPPAQPGHTRVHYREKIEKDKRKAKKNEKISFHTKEPITYQGDKWRT
jgi:hypothetical protein